ncbi:hypothetical protein FLW53_39710 [Microbispora sp. SCL1-1]|uniref:hypothetical protein n=1 Tax=unclassified Microbispora TaxID=2614687 RepID=UPI0011587527|nr:MULTISPECIES: hypothetical protein [unclassified Microbispora]NJP30217.1 hypothetical protein [Microbispora sp. CL1-1]TQS02398.1 hypothetical protein FLW53_39710 [Microbispora sp. SCL1-1]
MRRRSPQEKKRLSYAKDRRNDYGENDKSSRKNIRLSKKRPHRANRRLTSQVLKAAEGVVDVGIAAVGEERLLRKRPKSWKKFPDAPLGKVVQLTLRRRMNLSGGSRKRDAARIERVRRRLRQPAD